MNQANLPAFIEQELVSVISSIGLLFDDCDSGKMFDLDLAAGNSSLSLLICKLAEFGHYPYEERQRFITSLDSLFDGLMEQ